MVRKVEYEFNKLTFEEKKKVLAGDNGDICRTCGELERACTCRK